MLLKLRKIKRTLFANKQFHNYLLYAVGEMVLLVIGILIALQIDNWNTEAKQEKTLNNYLNIIASNIAHDLEAVADVRAKRESAYELAARWRYFGNRQGPYSTAEISFANRALNQARELLYFNATTSGYQALKSSGNLGRLQGRDIETLLYDYYDTVARISNAEQSHNEYVSRLWLQVLARWPANLDVWDIADPALMSKALFEAMQPAYTQFLSDVAIRALYQRAESTGLLVLDYERLDLLGKALTRMVSNGTSAFDDITLDILDGLYDPGSGIGYANVITDGQVAWQGYYPGTNHSIQYNINRGLAPNEGQQLPFHLRSFEKLGDSLHIDYNGGAEWAGVWFFVGTDVSAREHRDFRKFDKLVLELKGDRGGETVSVNMEDWDDPRDGSSTRIALQLTDQWQTYEIDLVRFETADLKILQSMGFIFLQKEPQSFSVRTIRYVDSDLTSTGASH